LPSASAEQQPRQASGGASVGAPSGLEIFERRIEAVCSALNELLDLSGVHYYDINQQNSGVVYVGWHPWRWEALPPEAAPKVGAARKALAQLTDFGARAARDAPDRSNELAGLEGQLRAIIEQPDSSSGAPKGSIDGIRELVDDLAGEYRDVVRHLPAAHGPEERVLVPDTSALIDRPDLQDWKVDGGPWTIVLVPQVLSELDDLKREARTREAAQKVINQIDEMDRRGDLFEGVPLARKLKLKEIAISPDMTDTLSWLRPDVPDDSIIASALELSWENLARRVAMTASDRNVRNKARLAGLGEIHPRDL
jgi:PIN domain